MNRLFKLLCLTILLMTLGANALAQDALPMPSETGDNVPKSSAIALNKPIVFGAVTPISTLSWTHIGAAHYTVKFRIMQTGQIVTWKPAVTCALLCTTTDHPDALFAAGQTANDLEWMVTAKLAGVKYKSEWRRAILTEVQASHLYSPGHNLTIPRNQVESFTWHKVELATLYTLVVRDVDSGATVIKAKIKPSLYCQEVYLTVVCIYSPNTNALKQNRHYEWFVKTVGPTGEKAKSYSFHLWTSSDLAGS